MNSVICICFIIFLIVLEKCYHANGTTWRYQSLQTYDGRILIRAPIHLSYTGSSANFTSWKVGSRLCTVDNDSSVTTEMHCLSSGVIPVSALDIEDPNGDESMKLLHVQEEPGCYEWHVTSMLTEEVVEGQHDSTFDHNGAPREETTQKHFEKSVRVWIVDPLMATERELNTKIMVPSEEAKVLTEQFQILGQVPRLKVFSLGPYSYQEKNTLLGFNPDLGCWEFTMNTVLFQQPHALVTGEAIALHDCFIRDTEITLRKETVNLNNSKSQISLEGNVVHPKLIKDPCLLDTALLLTSNIVWITQDGFKTYAELQMPGDSGLNTTQTILVEDAAITLSHIVLWIDSKLYFLSKRDGTVQNITVPVGLVGLKSRSWCFEGASIQPENEDLVMWSETKFYVKARHTELHFEEITVPLDVFTSLNIVNHMVRIHDVTFSTFPPYLAITVEVSNNVENKIAVVEYNMRTAEWSNVSTLMNPEIGAYNYSMVYLKTGNASVLVWNERSAWLGNVPGVISKMRLYNQDQAGPLAPNSTEFIHDISFSCNGEMTLLLSSGDLFYGRLGFDGLLKIQHQLSNTSNEVAGARFDTKGNYFFVEIQLNGTVTSNSFPLRNEVIGLLGRRCMLKDFATNMGICQYQLDLRDKMTFWGTILYAGHESEDRIEFSGYGLEMMTITVSSEFKSHSGLISQNKTVSLARNMNDLEVTLDRSKSKYIAFTVRPKFVDLSCPLFRHTVCEIYVGCPLDRHINVIRRGEENCTEYQDFNYTISKDKLGQDATEDKIVHYDYENLGCPIRVPVTTESFIPEITLCNSDVVKETVAADFILWEENGRIDYNYSATMKQVGCNRRAQSWAQMRQLNSSQVPLDKIWGPENYQNCFDTGNSSDPVSLWENYRYEVLNGSKPSGLVFPDEYNGIYIFQAKIIDPTYSSCDLKTRFAVYAYGAYEDQDTRAKTYSLIGFLSIVILGLLITYIYLQHLNQMEKLYMKQLNWQTEDLVLE